MKVYTPEKKENEICLFKKDVKFMDFHQVTFRYLNTTALEGETKTSLAMRIHDYAFPTLEAVQNYNFSKSKRNTEMYETIETALREVVRRAKISLALKDNHNAIFIGYWKYLITVFRDDAKLLTDTKLETSIGNFEQYVLTMK